LTDPSSMDHPLIMYHGPNSFESLSCAKCMAKVNEKSLKVKGAPSENWREVIELW